MSWYYNTQSGALTSAGSVQGFLQDVQSAIGLGADWHKLNIADTATEAQAAAEAKKEFPSGAAPTTSVEQQASQEATGSETTFTSVQNALTGFYTVLTNGKMWRSLGWLILGILLMLAGTVLLIGPAAARRSPLGMARRLTAGRTGVPGGAELNAPPAVETPLGRAPIIPLVITGAGMYLAWFAVHYWGSTTKWPTDPLKAVLQGKGIPSPTGQESAAQIAAQVEQTADTQTGVGATSTAVGADTTGKGVTYTKASLEALWTASGGSPGTADIASAIALAESAGQAGVTSSNPDGGVNVGLWQLDTRGVGAGYTVAQLQDPGTNARVTVMGSANGTNWADWQTYANDAYKAYL